MSVPKVFGREMRTQLRLSHLMYELHISGGPVFLEIGAPDEHGESVTRLIATGDELPPDQCAQELERLVRRVVESLGPLVGWAPLEKP